MSSIFDHTPHKTSYSLIFTWCLQLPPFSFSHSFIAKSFCGETRSVRSLFVRRHRPCHSRQILGSSYLRTILQIFDRVILMQPNQSQYPWPDGRNFLLIDGDRGRLASLYYQSHGRCRSKAKDKDEGKSDGLLQARRSHADFRAAPESQECRCLPVESTPSSPPLRMDTRTHPRLAAVPLK